MEIVHRMEKALTWRALLIIWILLFQVLMLIYQPSLPTPFLYDDFTNIVLNEDLRADRPVAAILGDHPTSLRFDRRPIGGVVTLFNFWAGGLNEKVFRATNVVIQWLCAGALGWLAILIAERVRSFPAPRLFSAALMILWAVHPIQSTAVIYITQRMELLMTLFFFLSCACLLVSTSGPASSRWWRAGAAMAAFLCLLSKENGAGLILLLAVLDRLFVVGSWRGVLKRHWFFYTALTVGWAAAAVWFFTGPRVAEWNDIPELSHPWKYFQTQCFVVFGYFKLIFWPSPLVFAPVPRVAETLVDWFPGGAALALIFGWWALKAKQTPWLWVPWLAVLLVLAPTSSFIPVPLEPAFDYRMHLPSAGALAVVLAAAWAALNKLSVKPAGMAAGLGLCIIALGAGTHYRASVYAKPGTIWMDTAAKEPENVKAWFNITAILIEMNKLNEAKAAAGQAELANQRFQQKWISAQYEVMMGLIAEKEQQWEQARQHYTKAIESQPDHPEARIELSRVLIYLDRPEEALSTLEGHAAQKSALSVEGQIWKAVALNRVGRLEEAREAASKADSVRAFPSHLEERRKLMHDELRSGAGKAE